MSQTKLVRVSSGAGQHEIVLGDLTTIGRQPTNTLQIVDRLVSKEHAVVARRAGTTIFVLTDLESRNGTFCNDRMVEQTIALRHDDEVRIGSTTWRFVQEEADIQRVGAAEHATEAAPAEEPSSASIHATMQIDFAHGFQRVDFILDERMLRADYEKLRLAYVLSQDLNAAPDIDAVLERLLKRIFEWLPVDRGVVLFLDPKGKAIDPADNLQQAALQLRPGASLSADDKDIRVPRSILRHVLAKREAVLSTDARLDARFGNAASVVLQGIRSSMTVPLLTTDRLLGVLHVDSLISSGLFAEKDLSVLASVSRQASISIDNVLLQRRVLEEAALRSSLSRMLSPNLVDRIVAGDLAIEKGGTQKKVTVMFADIRGFTSLTERLAPVEMVGLMNEYFERVSNVIFAHDGTLDKYIGDAVMALWGAPLGTDDDEIHAVRAGMQMQRVVAEFNAELTAEGKETIGIGIGIATATVIAGYVGSSQTMSYTVFGRGVNLAARLCSQAKAGDVMIAPATWHAIEPFGIAEQLDEIKLKGMADPVRPYRVIALR